MASSALGGVVFVAVSVLIMAALAHFIPRDGVAKHLYASWPMMENFKRADSFTECLNMGSALLDPGLQEDVLGFEKLARVDEPCPALYDYLASQDRGSIPTTTYTRYWNGPVVLARALFFFLDYIGVYALYAALTLAAFVLWGYALVKAGVSRNLSVAATLLVIWGGGFVFFGGNVAHAPAFFLPLFLLGHATLKTRWWENEKESVFLAASLGALTLWLDMLFEAVPFNALLLGLSLLLLSRGNALRRLILLLAAFGFGVAAMIALKFGVILASMGVEGLKTEYFEPLQNRMAWSGQGAPKIDYLTLVLNHLPESAAKIFGTVAVYWMYAAVAVASFVLAILKKRTNLAGLALLMLVVPVWYFLFPEHSWVHSGFSTQLLFWPWALMLIALAQDAKAFRMQKSIKDGT